MRKKGFTLIELLSVIAILAVIMVISIPMIINNINKSKEKSYDNQVQLFVDGAEKYALEYSSEIEWTTDEATNAVYIKVPLSKLIEYGYFDETVINPITGEAFNKDTTIVTIYKKNNRYEFEYEDETSKDMRLINNITSQTILQETIYNAEMIKADVYGEDKDGTDITKDIKYTCKYNQEVIECNDLSLETKELGTYYIIYSLESNGKTKTATRTINVISASTPKITVSPEDTGVKVDKVNVTIEYPEGAKTKLYSTKDVTDKNYTVSFDINENQTITANCIDKNGLKCQTATKTIDYIKPTIEVDNPDKGIVIAASWPNTESMTLNLSGVSLVKGTGIIEYKCKVGTKETAWSSSATCNITGLTGGTAYTVEVRARNKDNINDEVYKTTTIYTSKEIVIATKTQVGTCPSNNDIAVAETDIYESTTVKGSCSQEYGSTTVTSSIVNSESCGGKATLTYTYNGTTYSSKATSSCGPTSSSCISSLSYYACSVSSYSSAGCSSLSYYGCSVSVYSSQGCGTSVCSSILSYYACSKSSWSASGCSSLSYYACSKSSWSASGCSSLSYYACSKSSWSASGCRSLSYYACSKSSWSASGCSKSVCSSSLSYYACSVQIFSGISTTYSFTSTCKLYRSCVSYGSSTYTACKTYMTPNTASCTSLSATIPLEYVTCNCTAACAGVSTAGGSQNSCIAACTSNCPAGSCATCGSRSSLYSICMAGSYCLNYYTSSVLVCKKSVEYSIVYNTSSSVLRSSKSYYSKDCVSYSYTLTSTRTNIYKSILSASGCSVSVCSSSLSKYGCSVLINSASGCSKYVSSGCSVLINSASGCNKYVSSGCSVLINSASGCSKYVSSGCSVLINSASGCSKSVCSSSLSKYGCSVLSYSASGCSKYVSSGCSVLINSASGCSKSVCGSYKSYYTTTYKATIKYPTKYVITYTTAIVKPKQTIY